MNPMDVRPQPKPRMSPALAIWLVGIALIVGLEYLDYLFESAGRNVAIVDFFGFLAWLLVIGLTLYGLAIFARWVLKQLFWTVGRRLFLSYLLVGLLPFFLMTILLGAIVYMFAAVMTQAALRGERQATLGQLESGALEYVATGKYSKGGLPSLEIYDTANATGVQIPDWLRTRSYSGIASRDAKPLLVASRRFDAPPRTVVFVQPIDEAWSDQLYDRWGMIVRTGNAREEKKGRGNDRNINIDPNDELVSTFTSNVFRKIVWGDITNLTDWNTGQTITDRSLFTLIVNPPSNLFSYYFGAAANDYFHILTTFILALAVLLMMMYGVAALFAMVLIFSISRAVNRIERGTRAVERGDFTYRIRMRRNNQLGAMAQSFDHMTESIASLLSGVAEKERLQSEIAIAAEIQRNLLPTSGPDLKGVSFSAHFEPTASIGGDYYDIFRLGQSRLAVAIGDVSGHGLSTGLVMAMVKAAMTTLIEEGADETSLFRRLNQLVYRSTERRAFMTLAFTVFDLQRGVIRHTNAGHIYPYILRQNHAEPIAIEGPSLPLGVRPDITVHTTESELCEGDALVYLSDGIVEAQDEQGEPLGFDQLETILSGRAGQAADEVRNAILDAVARHSGTRPADDDRTVMVVRFETLEIEEQPEAALAAVATA